MRLPRLTAHARCIRIPPAHRTARAVEAIERNPLHVEENPRLRPVGGAFRVLARRLRRKFNRQRKGKRCRFPGKDRTGGRCARGRKRCPHHRRQGGRRHLSDHRRFQLEHVQDCGCPAHRGKRLHALRDDTFRHGLRQALHGHGRRGCRRERGRLHPLCGKRGRQVHLRRAR